MVSQTLELPRAFADEILDHARSETPAEACGLIAGSEGKATKLFRIPNADPSIYRYNMEPKAQLRAMQEIDDSKWELLAIYHSHTHTPAYPYSTDIELAFYPESFYVIVTLQDDEHPEIRAFTIVDGMVAETLVRIVYSAGSVIPDRQLDCTLPRIGLRAPGIRVEAIVALALELIKFGDHSINYFGVRFEQLMCAIFIGHGRCLFQMWEANAARCGIGFKKAPVIGVGDQCADEYSIVAAADCTSRAACAGHNAMCRRADQRSQRSSTPDSS